LVYKCIKKPESKNWDEVLSEVRILRQLKHPHIVPLLSSFRAGREFANEPNESVSMLYLIQPQAKMNLEDWMNSQNGQGSVNNESLIDLRIQIEHAICGLASALAFIHRNNTSHNDLKPSNIVGFINDEKLPNDMKPSNRVGFKSDMLIWKICDFGTSSVKLADDETRTSGIKGTQKYTPPEFWPKGRGKILGRSSDIFSMGCVFLELATIHKNGRSERGFKKFKEFEQDRLNNHKCAHKPSETGVPKDEDSSFFNNMVIVKEWLEQLRQGKNESTLRLKKILRVIEKMLNESSSERHYAWEVEMYVRQAVQGGEIKDEDLRTICQPPDRFYVYSETHNNPLKTAERNRDIQIQKILESKGWNRTFSPGANNLAVQPSVSGRHISTLPIDDQRFAVPGSRELYDRPEIDDKIERSFHSGTYRVALYGLWGMG
jgi:serine/threonine protein kinase